MNRFGILFFLLMASILSVHGQKVIVAMGSSTTMGAAATSNDSSWVGRLQAAFRKNTNQADPDTIIYKVGAYGFNTYNVMPTGWVSPIANRPSVDPANNITVAMSYHPDAVIINLPSNDVANLAQPWISPPYTLKETMDNFRVLYQFVISSGASCYITTTQPRNDLDATQRQMQKQLEDSIRNNFGYYSINFWDDLVTQDGNNALRDEVRHLGYADSQFHLNNYGHFLLYQKLKLKELFPLNAPLPTKLTAFSGQFQNNSVLLEWATADEQASSLFELQRSSNNRQYNTLHKQNGNGVSQGLYKWTDLHPLPGKSFYRLQIKEPGKTWYSNIISINNSNKEILIDRLTVAANALVVDLSCLKKAPVLIQLTNINGAVLQSKNVILSPPQTTIQLPIDNLATGEYFFSVIPGSGNPVVQRFIKMK